MTESQSGGPGGQSASGEATATLLWGNGNETSSNVTMFPAELGGYKVTTLQRDGVFHLQ